MIEFKIEKLKKPKNILIIASILCSALCAIILSAWRGTADTKGVKVSIGYKRLDKGSYFGFLVAMTVCLLFAKLLILSLKVLDLQEKIPYFDVFNLFFSGVMIALVGLACILGAVACSSSNVKHWSKHTLPAGVVFGWFALGCLTAETLLCYLELRKAD